MRLTRLEFNTLVAGPVHGTAALDLPRWLALDAVIIDPTYSIADRAAASRCVDAIVGDDELGSLSDEERVQRHAEIINDFRN